MRKILRLILGLVLVLLFVFSIVFSLVNKTAVPLSFGFLTLAPQPVSVWVVAAFCIGGVCGLLLGGLFRGNRRRDI